MKIASWWPLAQLIWCSQRLVLSPPSQDRATPTGSAHPAQPASTAQTSESQDAGNQEALLEKVATENNITSAHVKKLVSQASYLKPKKAASDYNILVHFKAKELNDGRPAGARYAMKDIHAMVKEDEDLMGIQNNKEAMAELRDKYDEEKADTQVTATRVSKRAAAKFIAGKIDGFQQEANFIAKATDAVCFRVVACGTFESSIQSGYFGRGPVDDFLWNTFNVGVQEFTYLFQDYCCT
ncbi:hypothetical protein BT96DRAFT_947937 [Gymnopus androsaceus JB14]|uniref:Uncharacterized protein n=1 Tax=Gymnopus androsaceus JB14 TaxID=1447944 RepID=A0A6A4GRR4_9AGAR|nr:hypothetical protein BT96DRAFT_947937 [Gymnopus androsaceus JB14]